MIGYLTHCLKEFNIFQVLVTILFTVMWTRTNTNKEIKTLSQQISQDSTEIKSEINQNALMISMNKGQRKEN